MVRFVFFFAQNLLCGVVSLEFSARARGLSVGDVGNVVKLPSRECFCFFVGKIRPKGCMPLHFLENHPAICEE